MEAVVSAGEAFVVGHHQLGAKLMMALVDGFEDVALVFVGGIGGDRISKSGWERELSKHGVGVSAGSSFIVAIKIRVKDSWVLAWVRDTWA